MQLRRQLANLVAKYADLLANPTMKRLEMYFAEQQEIVTELDDYVDRYSAFLSWIVLGFTFLTVVSAYVFVTSVAGGALQHLSTMCAFLALLIVILAYVTGEGRQSALIERGSKR